MFAVIKTGGKQYTVKEGDIFNVEKLEVEVGATHKIEEVLFISGDKKQTAGSPFIKGASIEVVVLEHGRADKVYVFKKKRRKDYRKRQGHRQAFTKVKVTKING